LINQSLIGQPIQSINRLIIQSIELIELIN